MNEIIRDALGAHAKVIETQAEPADLARAVSESSADVLLVAADQLELPRAWEGVLAAHPDLMLLALSSRGRRALVCELVEEVSGEWLIEAIRSRKKSA